MDRKIVVGTTLAVAALLAGSTGSAISAKEKEGSPPTSMPGQHHSFSIARHGDSRLPDHTILRPKDMDSVPFPMPVVAWANGGCRQSNREYDYFLERFASYGFFIIANGAPENAYHPEELDGLVKPDPQKLIDSMDWAEAENERRGSQFFGRLDTNRMALFGQSCGGGEALGASSDPRVKTTVVWNSGSTVDPKTGVRSVLSLHAPTLWATGGMFDITPLARADYAIASVPAVHADHAGAGHVGFWDAPSSYLKEPLVVGSRWLQLTLYGDKDAFSFFVGDNCGLCTRDQWTVQSKNWEGLRSP